MAFFPLLFESFHFLRIQFFAVDELVVFLELGNALVLDNHLLVVAPALGWGPFSKILGEGAEYFANSK